MTPTLIFWIKIGIAALVVFAAWSIIRAIRKQRHIKPSTPEEWKKLLPEVMFLGLGIFFLFWVEKNFQSQIDLVIDMKNKPLKGIHFVNTETGQVDSLESYKGKVVILNLWATWCGPCRRELPSLERLRSEHQDDVVVLALTDESTTVVNAFKNQRSIHLFTARYLPNVLLDELDSRPVSILIDKENRVQDVMVGAREYIFFKNWIKPYLGEAN